ncbi:MAG: hypothetical protein AB8G99_06750 [Planctomycetaceae bacterium]
MPTTTAKKSSSTASRKTTAKSSTSKARKTPVRKTSKLGRSRIPRNAPLDVVFEEDVQAKAAFQLLGIETIKELEELGPDELIMRLTSPTKQTVGRIRKMLALNNRCLSGDERFALEVQKQNK